MGLDITTYATIDLVEPCPLSDMDNHPLSDNRNFVRLYNLKRFQDRGNGLPDGFYKPGRNITFRAGSYGAYGAYRSLLSSLKTEETSSPFPPFHEQIEFSDSEGFLGPASCARLFEDYKKYENQAKILMRDWFQLYCAWLEAFGVASHNGVVRFHLQGNENEKDLHSAVG